MTQRHSIRHLGPASASDILVLEKFAIYTRIKPEISLKTLCALGLCPVRVLGALRRLNK